MVEYPFDEAIGLLTANLNSAKSSFDKYEADLNYVKDQVTITEVSTEPSRALIFFLRCGVSVV